jgi:hypothetical protein
LDVEGTTTYPVKIGTTYTNGSYTGSILALAPNMVAGETHFYKIGKADSANNAGYFGFVYNSAGSATNYATIGLYGVDHVLNVTGNSRVGIDTTTPKATLDVNGYAKLAINAAAPVTCGATYEGSVAYTGTTTHYNVLLQRHELGRIHRQHDRLHMVRRARLVNPFLAGALMLAEARPCTRRESGRDNKQPRP